MMPRVLIKNWSIVQGPRDGEIRIRGEVYDHPRFEDGTIVTTSPILKMSSMNTKYVLYGAYGSDAWEKSQ